MFSSWVAYKNRKSYSWLQTWSHTSSEEQKVGAFENNGTINYSNTWGIKWVMNDITEQAKLSSTHVAQYCYDSVIKSAATDYARQWQEISSELRWVNLLKQQWNVVEEWWANTASFTETSYGDYQWLGVRIRSVGVLSYLKCWMLWDSNVHELSPAFI
jgi:hypothetical protein